MVGEGDRGALGDSEKGLSATLVGGGSSCQVPSGGELGVLLWVGRCVQVAGSCCRDIVVRCLLCCGFDGLAAAPRSPCGSILVGRQFKRFLAEGGAVAIERERAANGRHGMAFQVVHRSMGVES